MSPFSQDHLDRGGGFSEVEFQPSISMDSPEALSSPARSHQGGHRTPMMLEEIHSHLVRSAPDNILQQYKHKALKKTALTVKVTERVRFWHENVHLSANHSSAFLSGRAVIG